MGNTASNLPAELCSLVGNANCNAAGPAINQVTTSFECGNSWPGWGGIKHLFTFGDSYSQTGFSVKGPQPSTDNPLGNPPYPGWTSCNGPNWVDFLTTTYNASALLTYNLADGGATIDTATVKPWKPGVQSLIDQVNQRFLPNYGNQSSWKANDSLFAFWIGINDVGNTYWDNNASRVDKEFGIYAGLLEEIYKSGARNFLFLDVPPLQRAPLTLEASNNQSVSREATAIKSWNQKLSNLSTTFATKHPDITNAIFSTYDLFNKVLDNPEASPQTAMYKSTDKFCAGYASNPQSVTKPANGCKYALSEYFWMNNLHPTYPVHNATAAELGRFLQARQATVGKMCNVIDRPGNQLAKGKKLVRKSKWRR